MKKEKCYCGLHKTFQDCCELILKGVKKATTAEDLMRSRYSAFATHQADYLVETTHVSERKYHLKSEILEWAINNQWQKLEVLHAKENTVEFKAYYVDRQSIQHVHHEFSNFIFEKGSWYYVNGEFY